MRILMLAAAIALSVFADGASAGLGAEQIRPVHSEKCLDVAFGSTANGARVIQFGCHGGDNQKWNIRPAGHGMFEIIAQHSGKCLDVHQGSLQDRAAIIQFDCHGQSNQRFFIERIGDDPNDPRLRIKSVSSFKCLDVEGGTILDHANLIQFRCADQTNQQYRIR